MRLPKTSRGVQNIQHGIGGILQVLNYTTAGVAALLAVGKIEWYIFGIVVVVSFILNRLSSEVTYQIQKRLFAENKINEMNMENI